MNEQILQAAYKMLSGHLIPIPLDGKVPQLKGWQNLTSVDRPQIDKWYADGLLRNVGVLCGKASGNLLVFDFDGMKGYEAFCEQFPAVAETLTVATGSGNGMHVYYRAETLPKSTGQLAVPGGHVEIKADGRQVVAPPSVHPDTGALYEVFKRVDMHPLSAAKCEAILNWIAQFNEPEPVHIPEPVAPENMTSHRRYAEAALNNETQLLAGTSAGGRNDQLNKAAMLLGQLVAAGHLTRDEVYRALFQACQSNGSIASDGKGAFDATFNSGFQAGMSQPRYIPDNGNKARTMPGPAKWEPSAVVKADNGVVQINRTRIVKRTSLLTDLWRRIDDDEYLPPVPPIEFPLQCLHHLGGQARVTKPGKIIGVVGASGSGKTTALETVADAYLDYDQNVAIWTPEWEPDEMTERALQRYGGPAQDDLYLFEIAKVRKSQGKPYNDKHWFTPEQRANAATAERHLRQWQTQVYYLENALMNVAEMGEVVASWRTILDPQPTVLIVDYAQLLKANDADYDDSSMYNMLQRFKSLCVYYGLIGIIATQTRKDDAEANINKGKFLGTTVLNCTKNSRGKKGCVRVESDPARLRIIDRPHRNQIVSDKSNLLGSQAGRWVNDDAFNLWITLNPEYEPDYEAPL